MLNKIKKIISNYGLLEQSLISLLNFIIIFANSKFLSNEEFADFIVIFSAITFIFLIVSNFCANPVLVFLPTEFNHSTIMYLKYLFKINIITSTVLSVLVLILIKLFFLYEMIFYNVAVAVILTILWSTYELIRKQSYARNKLGRLFVSSSILVMTYIIGNVIFLRKLDLTLSLEILLFSYLFSILFYVFFSKSINNIKIEKIRNRNILNLHWNFSKWTIIGGALYWSSLQGYFILLSKVLLDVELGALRTTLNFLGLMTIFLVLFENTYTPLSSTVFAEKTKEEFKTYIRTLGKKYFFPLIGLVVIVSLFSYIAFDLFFNDKYSSYKYLILIFGIYQLVLGLNRPFIVALRSMNKTKYFFIGNFLSALFTLTIGMLIANSYNVLGSALSILISAIISTFYFILSFKRVIKNYTE
ncbi:hypothetical protein N5C46_16040 [Rossellomorea vietnamensis]|uniref:Uncharacterized protein n=1 Tax=Rossellomorea vietnamensis TaxID=218284 RepID=A0ACD4C3W2_9BACI|nr:hypothetical protein [Rossellomorea vietnamensis]UXH43193.1 hypothetical protein N5C46_16040 [Rossellomorea vietnamensis]